MPKSFLIHRDALNDPGKLLENFKSLSPLKFPVFSGFDGYKEDLSLHGVTFSVSKELTIELCQLAEEHGVTLSLVMLAAYKILLQRYVGQDDIFVTQIGAASAWEEGQSNISNDEESFSAIRSLIDGERSFREILNQLKVAEIENYPAVSLTANNIKDLCTSLGVGPEIFKALFQFTDNQVYVNSSSTDSQNELAQINTYFQEFFIGLNLKRSTEFLSGTFYYNSLFVDEIIVSKIKEHYQNVLSCIVAHPESCVGSYQVLTKDEWEQIIVDFNDTVSPYEETKLIHTLFEESVVKNFDNAALIKGKKVLSYGQLNKLSNRLSHYLISKGVRPGDNVGLIVGRGFDMIIGMLAILKAGGAYVPIDPDYPVERQEYIFNQSSIRLVIGDKDYPLKSLIDHDTFMNFNVLDLALYSEHNPDLTISSRQLAYTIYTSGSTGIPKGVMIEHHSAINLISWVNNRFSVNSEDRLLFITSMCFDLSVYDIFGILAVGGKLVIAEQAEIQDVKKLQRMIVEHKITFWDSVPTTLDYLIQNLEAEEPGFYYQGLKIVFLSGDWIPKSLPDRIKKIMPQAQVISLGGATEGTVWSNYFPVEETKAEWNSIPYGKPIANNFFYILNKQLQPQPFGIPGDLYIGGVGVARGYAKDRDKTAASFVRDPFNELSGGMMYKTGDLGRMMFDQNMEFIGRIDNQVKINGFRIELGEIENVLKSCSLIANAIVLAGEAPDGKKRLIAYLVPEKYPLQKELVIAFARTKLPSYMIPAIWMELQALPLTSNGKIDRKALPDVVSVPETVQDSKVSLTQTEIILKSIWEDSMNKSNLSVTANFFELGGHSLMAVQILSKFQKRTGKSFPLAVFFKHPSIALLAKFIDGDESLDKSFSSLVPVKASGYKPPLYIIHGEGLNVLNFSNLAACIDPGQPIYGLQAKGLDEIDTPLDSIPDIAAHYINEILLHNPHGPYLLSGYSFGGYVAVEMNKQLTAMGKVVKMLIMFDTNAEKTEYKDWYKLIPKKVKRKIPKLLSFIKLSITQPITTFKGQSLNISKKIGKMGSKKFYQHIKKIKQKHLFAFRNYQMAPFDQKIHLFKADICVHYVNDENFLGWKNYARKGVEVVDVPGDHLSMLEFPHVEKLAAMLQQEIDKSNSFSNPF